MDSVFHITWHATVSDSAAVFVKDDSRGYINLKTIYVLVVSCHSLIRVKLRITERQNLLLAAQLTQ